jgi:hypothetical protein
MEPELFCIATAAARGEPVVFSDDERARHIYIVGKTGMGKSTLQYNLAMLDIFAGRGVAVIDPHGDLAEAVADSIPRWRINEVCYLNVADTDQPIGFNPLANVPPDRRAPAAAGMVSAFKHLWGDSWGPRLEHLLYHGLSALLDRRQATLIDLPRLYTDERFREATVRYVSDPIQCRDAYRVPRRRGRCGAPCARVPPDGAEHARRTTSVGRKTTGTLRAAEATRRLFLIIVQRGIRYLPRVAMIWHEKWGAAGETTSESQLGLLARWGKRKIIRRSISVSNKAGSRRSRGNHLGELNADLLRFLRSFPPNHAAMADG